MTQRQAGERTKQMFAEQLIQLLETRNLEAIIVTELCKLCHARPQLFYYHFHDKYELITWIYLRDCAGEASDPLRKGVDGFLAVFERIEARRAYYQRVFRDTSQNALAKYLQAFNVKIATEAVRRANNGAALTNRQNMDIHYFSYGTVGSFLHWLYGELDVSAAELAALHYESAPPYLRDALDRCIFTREETLSMTLAVGTANGIL